MNCNEDIHALGVDGKKVFLIGTAHISRKSADFVEDRIRAIRPDSVCIELCEARYDSIQNPERWSETDIFEVISSGRSYLLFSQLILSGLQKRIAKRFDIKPGEEVHRAISTAREVGAELVLADRNVRTTLKRAWANTGPLSVVRVMASLITALFVSEDVTEEEIENLKSGDLLASAIGEFSDYLPGVKRALIDERDAYLAAKIRAAPGPTVLAVVGAGHVPGIKRLIHTDVDLEKLEEIPPRSKIVTLIIWAIPLAILSLMVYGFTAVGADVGKQMIWGWVLANGVLSAAGAALALAHPLTILSAFVAAPITSLNPMIAAGWVSGLVETLIRKPRVCDLESVAEDVTGVWGFWRNRVTRILLVVIFSNVGSVLGTYVGGAYIGSLLFGNGP